VHDSPERVPRAIDMLDIAPGKPDSAPHLPGLDALTVDRVRPPAQNCADAEQAEADSDNH
jgi:hypothetical protein